MNSEHLTGASRVLVGEIPNHWLYCAAPPTYDLTRPSPPHFPPPTPQTSIKLSTTTEPIIISPKLTALVIVDMQNLFLSPSLGHKLDAPGNLAKGVLLQTTIPAARKAGIKVVWMNWGLTDEDLENAPPSVVKAFGFNKSEEEVVNSSTAYVTVLSGSLMKQLNKGPSLAPSKIEGSQMHFPSDGSVRRRTEGLGVQMGPVKLEDGKVVEGGRRLFRDTWNAALPSDLGKVFKEGQTSKSNPDILIHKNRMSGFWDRSTNPVKLLEEMGIRTLLFAGTKTDMCVMASLLDAWHAGFDVILLTDACGTTSPSYASDAVEFNCARIWGFVSDSKNLEKGVNDMLDILG